MMTSECKRALLYRSAQANICKCKYFKKIQSFICDDLKESDFIKLEETDGIIGVIKGKKIKSEVNIEVDSFQQLADLIRGELAFISSYLLMRNGSSVGRTK